MIFLYIKTCEHCGLKYFGKTNRYNNIKDIHKYKGSGLYWVRHLRKYNSKYTTIIVNSYDDENECKEFAIQFSINNDIVKSNKWANLIYENGLNGGDYWSGKKHSETTKIKMSKSMKGKRNSLGHIQTNTHRKNIGNSMRGKNWKQYKLICPHCNKEGGANGMKRYHFDNCKKK